jgi:hypothetical protein
MKIIRKMPLIMLCAGAAAMVLLSSCIPQKPPVQESPIEIEWSKEYGTGGEYTAMFNGVEQMPDSSFRIFGYGVISLPEGAIDASSFEWQPDATQFSVGGLDGQGDLQWLSEMDAASLALDPILDMACDKEGNLVAAGKITYRTDQSSGVLVKYSPDGQLQWLSELDRQWMFQAVELSESGGYIVGGGPLALNEYHIPFFGDSAVIAKYDADGNEVWLKQFEEIPYPISTILALANGDYLFYGNGGDSHTLGEIDDGGNVAWTKTIDQSTLSGNLRGFVESKDGGFVGVGETSEDAGIDESTDFLLAKFDHEGSIVWSKNYGGSAPDELTSIVNSDDGGYLAVGNTWSTDGIVEEKKGTPGSVIAKLNAIGQVEWLHGFGVYEGDSLTDIVETDDSSYVAVGYVYNDRERTAHPDAIIMKFTLKE